MNYFDEVFHLNNSSIVKCVKAKKLRLLILDINIIIVNLHLVILVNLLLLCKIKL